MTLAHEPSLEAKRIEFFSEIEGKEFFEKNKYEIALRPESEDLNSDMLRCIDDRPFDNGKNAAENPIAIPGAGLGVLQDCFGGFELLRKKQGIGQDIAPERIAEAFEAVMGPASLHTDMMHLDEQGLACAGCGHCAGALAHPEEYLQSPAAVAFLEKSYIPGLEGKGVAPRVRAGSHNAKAVYIIDPLEVGLQGWDPEGNQAYVYNRGWHKAILNKLASKMMALILPSAEAEDIKIGEAIKAAFWESAQVRLGHTVEHLAPTHPKFIISEAENHEIEVKLA